MKVNFNKLYAAVAGSNTFTKAFRYAGGNRIYHYSVESRYDDGGEEIRNIRAKIRGNSGTYDVSIDVDGKGEATAYTCSCEEEKPCKHIVALSYYCEDADRREEQKIAPVTIKNPIFSQYKSIAYARAQSLVTDKVTLLPIFIYGYGYKPCLKLKIGRDKMYVIKNIMTFSQLFQGKKTFKYGDKLELCHDKAAFVPECRKLLTCVISCGDSMYLGDKTSDGTDGGNLVPIAGELADVLFDMYEGKQMQTENRDEYVTFEVGDPDLKLRMTKNATDGFSLRYDGGRAAIIRGVENSYVFYGNTVYRCSDEYINAVEPIVRQLARTERIKLSPEHLEEWLSGIMPIIERYIVCDYTDIDTERYTAQPLKAGIYFDLGEEGISAELKCFYGENEIDLFDENADAEKRNVSKEMIIKAIFNKYFEGSGARRQTADDSAQYALLTDGIAEFEKYCDVYATEKFNGIKIKRAPTVSAGVRIDGELLRLNLTYDTEYTREELVRIIEAYRAKKRYIKISSDKFVDFQSADYGALDTINEISGKSLNEIFKQEFALPKYRALYLDKVLKGSGVRYTRDSAFKDIVKGVGSFEDADYEPGGDFTGVLRHYQKIGYRWFKSLAKYGFGGILADDMGLGKSVQAIAFLKSLQKKAPSIVICPSSLILNWQNEFRKFAPDMKVLCVYGMRKNRAEILEEADKFDVIITSYELLKQDFHIYGGIHFAAMMIDEGQYIKNHTTKNAKAVKSVKSDYKFALTGTPIENNIAELWSIFDFIMPGYLYTYHKFRDIYENPIVKENDTVIAEQLHKMVAPFILRRLKKDVLRELPPKVDHVMRIPLEEKQRDVYAATLATVKGDISGLSDTGSSKITVLSYLTKLRQICCDPGLVFEKYDGNSEKLEACLGLIHNSVASGHKVLLFSQFTSMLDIIEKHLKELGISYYLLTGKTPNNQRMNLIERFNHDDTNVFLLSLRAGGTGINLTGADTVIHYDPWWNLSVQNQATDRAHRIGQNKSVQVYRLILQDTVEERILELQDKKQELFDTVIREGQTDITKFSVNEILELLE